MENINLESAKQISKSSKSSFYYAFNLLPVEQRDAMNTVYAFCRRTDDIVDEDFEDNNVKYENLRKWRNELERGLRGQSEYSLLNKLSIIIRKFNIPLEPFFELIKGMEMDLQNNRYQNMEELLTYCYRVASTVGLMCIEIFGYKNKSARNYAINLGLAMQLTNILRDVKKDAEKGRIYLPQSDLNKFNYSENDLFNNIYNNEFIALMQHEGSLAKKYFKDADEALNFEDKPSMFAARAMQHIYFKLLKRLEEKKFDIYSDDINVTKFEKASIAVGVWAKYSLVY
ncbi:MAG: squalene synthase HpnD [Ignavibacteriae bacterium HGW-Ignavibacteriae-2]|jgi:phytoene synthase|nr:presqualene diphosphate synthase HpnD [Bacteroidota bacterium]PKL88742.1 MAG: squalene synthase HpnD [Ignavibacteriae bacterium HGW-Ignavibacteriae-2]